MVQTEDIQSARPERDVRQLSVALCHTAPSCVAIHDDRGRPVSLSLAGFVVQPGRRYEIRAKLDQDQGTPDRPRIIDTAGIVDYQNPHETRRHDKEDWLCLRVKVSTPGIWLRSILGLLWYHKIVAGEVVVEWEYSKMAGTRTTAKVPLIVRKPLFHWRLLLWFVAWFLVGALFEGVYRLASQERWQENLDILVQRDWHGLLSRMSVPWVAFLALSWPITRIFWNLWRVSERARALQASFARKVDRSRLALATREA
jgi:hypothetical protein